MLSNAAAAKDAPTTVTPVYPLVGVLTTGANCVGFNVWLAPSKVNVTAPAPSQTIFKLWVDAGFEILPNVPVKFDVVLHAASAQRYNWKNDPTWLEPGPTPKLSSATTSPPG